MVVSRWAVLKSILCVAVLVAGAAWVGSARADDGAWKAANDTDPHVPLTPYQDQMQQQKESAVVSYFSAVSGIAAEDPADGDSLVAPTALAGAPASASLIANQQPQQTSYWCGPAAVVEALGQMGIGISQSTAAAKLGTTTAGTPWSGGHTRTGFPVPDVLNLYQSRNYFLPQPVGGAGDLPNYKSFLVYNIVNPVAPLIGDAWEARNSSYHLVGHPSDHEIFHWFDIRGYTGSGASTMYEDSVHGAPSIGWSPNVPAYSTLASSQIVSIVSGRGYVW